MRNNNISALLIIFFSAFLLIFSFPPFNLSLMAWFAFIPLLFILNHSSPSEIFTFYYLAGLIFWLYHIWWLTYVTFLGYSLLVIYLASFWGLGGLLLKFLKEKTQYPLLFLAPPVWVLLEFIRTYLFTGFPWSLLGYSQWRNTSLIQISSITGVYGVSFLIVMVNAAIADFIFANPVKNSSRFVKASKFFYGTKTKKHSCLRPLGFGGQVRNLISVLLIITVIVVLGEIIISKEDRNQEKIKISVIQGNISQTEKWDEQYKEEILDIYTGLSIEAVKTDKLSIIIWPETSYPDYVYENGELFGKIVELTYNTNTPLLIGGLNYIDNKDYNSAFLILPYGQIQQTYNKLHLVPFGEYIPLTKIFFFLNKTTPQIADFSKGNEYTIFRTPITANRKPSFAVLICFEDLFPALSRKFTLEGADFLVNITNDAHFHESPALWQHFTHSVFRAVENRKPVVRAANNGISGFIDYYGRPVKILNKNGKAVGIRGYASNQINLSTAKTFYTCFGDLFVYVNILYLGSVLIITTKRNTKKL